MSSTGDESTVADKAFEAGKKAASAVGSGLKKATNYATESISATKGATLVKVMRIMDVILAVALIATYPIDILTGSIKMGLVAIFMFIYCVCFSLLLIFFETGLGKYEAYIKKYFGFMYTYMGRTVFLLFTVAMVFGGTRTDSDSLCVLNIIVGTIGIIICLFDFFVVCNHPAFKKGGEFYNAGVEEGEEGAPQKKPTEMKQKETKRAAESTYESNPFESSDDDDIPSASVPGAKKSPKSPKKSPKKAKKQEDNPFEDDNPFDD